MKNKRRLVLLACAAAAMPVDSARAAASSWTFNGSGNWTLASNWLGGVPTAGGSITISHNDATSRTITYDYAGASIQFNSMIVENSPGGFNLFSQSANTFNIASETIGNSSIGVGFWSLSGGIHNVYGPGQFVLGSVAGSKGTGTLSGTGSLNVNGSAVWIGLAGLGTFVQSGGSFTCNNDISLGVGANGSGTYLLNGGTIGTAQQRIGQNGMAVFSQTGGGNSVGDTLAVGVAATAVGTYNLSGGSLTPGLYIVAGGSFSQAGGSGIINVSGGTILGSATLKIWNTGTTAFNFAGGQVAVGSIDTSGNINRFNWTGGSLIVNGAAGLSIGPSGPIGGNLAITATKSLTVSNTLAVSSGGLLSLSASLVSAGSLDLGGDPARLNWTSGTLRQTSSNFTVGAAGPLGSSVQLNTGQHLEATGGPITVEPSALLYLPGGSALGTGGINNSGQIELADPAAQLSGGALVNSGIVSGNGRISNNLSNASPGIVRASGTDWLQFSGVSNTNSGQLNLFNGGAIEFTHSLINTASGVISGRGILIATGGLTNSGTMSFSAGLTDVYGAVTNNSRITVTGGSTSTFYDSMNTSVGSITVNTASTAVFIGNVIGQSHISGPGTKDFEAGASGGPVATIVGNTIVGSSGNVTADYIRENSLIVMGTSTVPAHVTPNDPTGTSVVKSLTIVPGGKLDLTNNSMVIDYTAPIGTLLTDTRQNLQAGRLTSASADATHRLGYADNTFGLSTFAGQPVDASSVLVKFTYAGDANLDGKVNIQDLLALATHYNTVSSQVWTSGDFNYDGAVNRSDLTLLAATWQLGIGAPLGGSLDGELGNLGLPGVAVPEPVGVIFAAAGLAGLRRRRRR